MNQLPLALVLSGGSVRAATQVGVIKALAQYHIFPDIIVGTSGGSFIAALHASGMSGEELENLIMSFQTQKKKIVDYNWVNLILGLLLWQPKKLSGLVMGHGLQAIIHQHLKKCKDFQGLGELATKDKDVHQLLIPAVNLRDGKETVFCDVDSLNLPVEDGEYQSFRLCNHGSIAEAVRASISIPGIFVPAKIQNQVTCHCYRSKARITQDIGKYEYFLDGGIRNGYPMSVAIKLGQARQIIGVNLGYAGLRREDVLARGPIEVLNQSLDIMMMDQVAADLNDSALRRSQILTINPLIYDIHTFELEYIPQMIERGYQVTVRLCEEKRMIKQGDGVYNRKMLFADVWQSTFPQKGTPYFQEMIEHQIKEEI